MLALWGDRWLLVDDGPAFLRYHDHCGKSLTVKPLCDHCGEELKRSDIDFESIDEV